MVSSAAAAAASHENLIVKRCLELLMGQDNTVADHPFRGEDIVPCQDSDGGTLDPVGSDVESSFKWILGTPFHTTPRTDTAVPADDSIGNAGISTDGDVRQ